MTSMRKTKWDNYILELSNIIFFWFFSIFFFLAFRVAFILFFVSETDWNSVLNNISQTLITGFRFDTMVVSYFIIIPFFATLITSIFNKIHFAILLRKIFQFLFITLSTLLCVITINYYQEYNNQFNHFLFLGLYDDLNAVLKTIIEDFSLFQNLFIISFIYYLSFKFLKYTEHKTLIYSFLLYIKGNIIKPLFVILCLILFMFSIRGSIEKRPIMRQWAYVTNDDFLNKTIINPYKSLLYAIEDFNDLNIPEENPFGDTYKLWKEKSVCENIKRKAKGAFIKKPRQIFLVVMESYDSWPLEKKYLPFELSKNLSEISNNGILFNNFIPSSESTMNSISSIITGIPYSGVSQSLLGAINPTYCSSIFNQIEKLGYSTNFFYGGLLSWQNLNNVFDNQGVDNKYSAVEKGGKTKNGVWGIEDEYLFELVNETIDTSTFSFNLILTTSYHPPYSINVLNKGFPENYLDNLPKDILEIYDGSMSLKELSHLWYSDKCIGDFVKNAQLKFPNALFLFTGDHYGRRFINSKPNILQKNSVPFIIYGNSISESVLNNPGSHIDIFPTLIEMIAPKGFTYFSFGESLFKSKEIGIGKARAISNTHLEIYHKTQKISSFNLNSLVKSKIDSSIIFTEYKKLNALGWHYTIKGDSIY